VSEGIEGAASVLPVGPRYGATNGRRLSELLGGLSTAGNGERISVGEITLAFGERAFGALIFVFAAPNAIPIPMPGLSALLGLPLVFLAVQLLLVRPRPWLPGFLRDRSIPRRQLAAAIAVILPWLERVERLIRPRMMWLSTPVAERAIGLLALILAVVLFLPIPFGNMLPGLALALLALGLLERDGLLVLAGMVAGTAGLALVSGALVGLVVAAVLALRSILTL
jgi:hypothetical protein